MLCTLNWARERGFESADIPLHVYGPPGLADYIRLDSDPVCVFFPISFLGQCCCVQVLFAVSVAFALDSQHMLLAQCYPINPSIHTFCFLGLIKGVDRQ